MSPYLSTFTSHNHILYTPSRSYFSLCLETLHILMWISLSPPLLLYVIIVPLIQTHFVPFLITRIVLLVMIKRVLLRMPLLLLSRFKSMLTPGSYLIIHQEVSFPTSYSHCIWILSNFNVWGPFHSSSFMHGWFIPVKHHSYICRTPSLGWVSTIPFSSLHNV